MGPASLQIELKSVRVMMCEAGLKLFFSEPILGPPNVDFSRENANMNVKKSDIARTSPSERFVCRLDSAFAGGATCPAGSF